MIAVNDELRNNFKAAAISAMLDHKKALYKGDIAWNINNQFDESHIDSALVNIHDDEKLDNVIEVLGGEVKDAPSVFHMLSSFEVEALAAAWYD